LAAGIDDATRRKLERLCEDCRRHPEHPVRMVWLEGPLGHRAKFELALEHFSIPTLARMGLTSPDLSRSTRCYLVGKREEAAPARVLAWLERLGRLAEETRADLGGERAQTGFARAAQIVCAHEIARKRTVSLAAPTVERDERGGVHLIVNGPFAEEVEIEIPDAAAALAAAIDELLRAPSAPKQADAEEFVEPMGRDADALGELWLLGAGERKTGADLAHHLGIEPRPMRALVKRLKDQGWPIKSKGAHGGGYSLGSSLSRAQRDWLESRWPED
jgi:biotin operon repressor